MFPTWSDWDIKYTAKGLLKQRVKKSIGILALVGAIIAFIRLRKNPPSVADLKALLRNYVKCSLLTGANILQVVETKL